MKTDNNEVMLYYDGNSSIGRKVRAYAYSLAPHIKDLDYGQAGLTGMLWREILSMLQTQPKEILNKSHPYYRQHIRGRDFDDEGWLNILLRNPEVIRAPIAIRGRRAVLCDNPTDIYKLMQEELV